MIWGLLNNHLAVQEADLDVVRQFKDDMREQLHLRFPLSIEQAGHPFVIASILDPAHKHLPAVHDNVRQAAYTNVRALLGNLTLPEVTPDENEESNSGKRRCPGLDFILGEQYCNATATVSVNAEFDSYLSDKSAIHGDALLWWKSNSEKYARVAMLARRYLAIPPTSVASERVFSLSGRVITKTRNRLLPETATCLVFLDKNLDVAE